MKKCIIYVRVSTDKQETDRQKSELTNYAKSLGYTVIAILEDIESGLHDERPQFMKLLSYTKNEVDAVLVWEISRIGRKTSTVIKTIEDWTNRGICFISKKENLMSLDSDGKMNANTKLFLSIMATIAENEANTIKERMKSGKIFKLRNGGEYADKTPFGYVKVNGKFQLHPDNAALVKKAFEMRRDKVSVIKISKLIGQNTATTHSILRNEVYKGIGRNKYVPDMTFEVPKIVDDELWMQVQSTFTKIAKRTDHVFAPLRMKMICPICGRHYSYGKERNGNRYYCNCQEIEHPKYSRIINAQKAESAVESLVNSMVEEKSYEEMQIESPAAIKEYIISLEEKKNNLKRTFEIAKKKLDAVRDLLTQQEINDEQIKIGRLFDKIMNIDVEIDAGNARLSNAIVLSSAPLLPLEVTGWWEYVKEVKLVEFSAGHKKLEVELINGKIGYCEIDAPRGWGSVLNKEANKRPKKKPHK